MMLLVKILARTQNRSGLISNSQKTENLKTSQKICSTDYDKAEALNAQFQISDGV